MFPRYSPAPTPHPPPLLPLPLPQRLDASAACWQVVAGAVAVEASHFVCGTRARWHNSNLVTLARRQIHDASGRAAAPSASIGKAGCVTLGQQRQHTVRQTHGRYLRPHARCTDAFNTGDRLWRKQAAGEVLDMWMVAFTGRHDLLKHSLLLTLYNV